jgi:hypothetical protein
MKRTISIEIVNVLSMGLMIPARKMNAKTSDMVTEARIVCPVAVFSSLY